MRTFSAPVLVLLSACGPTNIPVDAVQPILTQAIALCGDGNAASCDIRYYGEHRYNLDFHQPPSDSPWRVQLGPDPYGRLSEADEISLDEANLQLLEELGVDLMDARIRKTNLRSRAFRDGILETETIERTLVFAYHEIDGIPVTDERVVISRLPTGEVDKVIFAWGTRVREVLGNLDESERRALAQGEIESRLAAGKFVAQLPPETVDVVTRSIWVNMGDLVLPAVSVTWGLGDDVDGDGVGSQAHEIFVDGVTIRDVKVNWP